MDGFLPVKVIVPLEDYRRLHAEARAAGVTVAERIAQIVASPMTTTRTRMGRPSGYSPRIAQLISAEHRLGRSWRDIGRDVGINHSTAKDWAAKYETEVREQNMRNSAGRKAS